MSLIARTDGPEAADDKLFFAQVREDADIELAVLEPVRDGRIAVVSSGGCIALSVLAAGAAEVHAVDLNRTQNNVVELKAVAAARLPWPELLRFLDAHPGDEAERARLYAAIRSDLGPRARDWLDANPKIVAAGVLHRGVTEKFVAGLMATVRRVVASPDTFDDLLSAPDVATQQAIFDRQWNNRRWRMLLAALCNRKVFDRVYAEGFFTHTGRSSFAEHFGGVIRHVLTELPTATNPYVHDILTGHFGDDLPSYLTEDASQVIAASIDRLRLWDQPLTTWLTEREDGSLDGVTLSNICEWFQPAQTEDLFAHLARVVRPGGVVVMRNFVGWTDLPPSGRRWFDVDPRSEQWSSADRSMMQYRVVVLHRREQPLPPAPLDVVELGIADADELHTLARSNPIRSSAHYVVDRSRFGAVVDRIEGAVLLGGRVDDELAVACCMLPFDAQVGGHAVRVIYGGGMVANPTHSGRGRELMAVGVRRWEDSDSDVLIWLTNDDNERVTRAIARAAADLGVGPDRFGIAGNVTYTEVVPLVHSRLPRGWSFGAATAAHRPEVLELINTNLAGRVFHAPVGEEDLTRLPHADAADLLALHDDLGRLRAAAWVWEPAPFAQVVPIKLDAMSSAWARTVDALRAVRVPLPEPPHEGEPIRTVQLRRLAALDDEAAQTMVGQVGNLALDRRAHTVSYVDDPRAAVPRVHTLVFTYPARLGVLIKPGAPLTLEQVTAAPLAIDVSLT